MTSPQDVRQFIGRTAVDSEGSKVGKIGQVYLDEQTGMPLWSIAPGLCVALLGVSFALINYAFDEISNPALRPVRRRHVKRARVRNT